MARKTKKKPFKLITRMKRKLFVVFYIVILGFAILAVRISYISIKSGDAYQKKVLAQQEYSSQTIPYRRGDIVDRKGTVLATSTDVYNVILDCSVLTSRADYMEPTINALSACFELNGETCKSLEDIRSFISSNKESRYYVIAQRLPREAIQDFKDMQSENRLIKGIWFEKEYQREYPYEQLASGLIGFTAAGNVGVGGLEDYYNNTLNGTNGRKYGYLNSDDNYEVTTKDAIDGQTIVSTIDINLQSIVEKTIQDFLAAYENAAREGNGAKHIAVIMMDPNTGEQLAMADYPNYDYTLSSDENLEKFYDPEELVDLDEKGMLNMIESLKQNFCITYTYEPGSTAKPFTVAAGLETGAINENMTFECDGLEHIADYDVHCVNRMGHGLETLSGALEDSCNDSLMQMSYRIGAEDFARYQRIFNFGLKTNIDLPGETRTDSLIYSEEQLEKRINLATNSFGQNFNVTMIQLASAYASLVNGGSYYQPHMVSKILDAKGNTVKEINPTLLRQTVSNETAGMLRQYLQNVVDKGTGSNAKVDGYSMCGKTGTAQKFENGVRAQGKYLVSFIGSVPAEDPQIICYAVVDEPNTDDQAHSYYAQRIVREILEEALPYLNIYPDEELKGTNVGLDVTNNPDHPIDEVVTPGDVFDPGTPVDDVVSGEPDSLPGE